jgi:hypothetical protein
MTQRAVLVMGPESSGTRLATRILVAAGCQGDDGHEQRWDAGLPVRIPSMPEGAPLVWRRSVPHGGRWPDLVTWIQWVRTRGYAVQAVVTTRDWRCMVESQVQTGHVRTPGQATNNIERAYDCIFGALGLALAPFVTLSYESLVQRPERVQRWLAETLRLPRVPQVPVCDGNEKYWGMD